MSSSRTGYTRQFSILFSDMRSALTWSLDVADDATGSVVHELDADLGHTTTRACT